VRRFTCGSYPLIRRPCFKLIPQQLRVTEDDGVDVKIERTRRVCYGEGRQKTKRRTPLEAIVVNDLSLKWDRKQPLKNNVATIHAHYKPW
jgi:hypothetical protein